MHRADPYAFKTAVLGEVSSMVTTLRELLAITKLEATDAIATATSMAGHYGRWPHPVPVCVRSTKPAPSWRTRWSTSNLN
jgi:hypothetical protein